MAGLLCKIGLHQWNGCACTACPATRDEGHDWHGCTCSHCGATREHDWYFCVCKRSHCDVIRDVEHSWDEGCRCTTCRVARDHDWDGCRCRRCKATREEGHDWDACHCRRCNKASGTAHDRDRDGNCRRCGARAPASHSIAVHGACPRCSSPTLPSSVTLNAWSDSNGKSYRGNATCGACSANFRIYAYSFDAPSEVTFILDHLDGSATTWRAPCICDDSGASVSGSPILNRTDGD